ncbi:MAG: sigma-70 family RNA polymerase sigma factor [Anaerolineaceae bacterium]|nr:sigma-70 family RNA polymerase sigma factor [Anaerolineaceae bacterium]
MGLILQTASEHKFRHSPYEKDEELVLCSQNGCTDCLGILFHRFLKLIEAIGWKVLHQEADVEDLIQEVFLTIYERRSLYDSNRGSAKTWIAHLAYWKALMQRRYLNTRKLTPLDETLPFEKVAYYDNERITFVEQILTLLNPRQRRTIELVLFEGYTLLETAAVLQESLANTRNLYYRGMQVLRMQLKSPRTTSNITDLVLQKSLMCTLEAERSIRGAKVVVEKSS